MGIPLGGGNFTRGAAIPLDDSFVQADATARDAIGAGIRYEGMLVYVVADGLMYQLQGGITNGDWAVAGGGGGGATPIIDSFTGDGSDVTFTLSVDPGTEDNTLVFISGAHQGTDTYSISGTTLTFSEAPPLGVAIKVIIGSTTTVNVPADGSVTKAKLAALGEQISSSCGTFSSTSTTAVDVTNLTVTVLSTGRLMYIGLVNDGSGNESYVNTYRSGESAVSTLQIMEGATVIYRHENRMFISGGGTTSEHSHPVNAYGHYFKPTAGTHTYKVQVFVPASVHTIQVRYAKLVAYEI